MSRGGLLYRKKKAKPVTVKTVQRIVRNNGVIRGPKVYKIKKQCLNVITAINSQTALTTFGAFTFILDDLPNSNEYKGMYDEYMITKIIVTFHSRSSNGFNALFYNGFLHTAVDIDDNTPPTSVAELMEYETYKVGLTNRTRKITLVPAVSTVYYKTALTTGYGSKQNQWIDCADGGIPHFGLKFALGNSANAAEYSYLITCQYFVSFRLAK